MDAARVSALLEAATGGPWNFATAPHDPENETKEEFVTGALNRWSPEAVLWTCWAADPEGGPEDYVIPALTGDGPTSRANAEFIAAAPEIAAWGLGEHERAERLAEELAALKRAANRSLGYTNTALGQIPGTCRYHGLNIDQDGEPCCDTGKAPFYRHEAVEANRTLWRMLGGAQ